MEWFGILITKKNKWYYDLDSRDSGLVVAGVFHACSGKAGFSIEHSQQLSVVAIQRDIFHGNKNRSWLFFDCFVFTFSVSSNLLKAEISSEQIFMGTLKNFLCGISLYLKWNKIWFLELSPGLYIKATFCYPVLKQSWFLSVSSEENTWSHCYHPVSSEGSRN